TVTNVAPTVGELSGPSGSPPAQTVISVSASFTDAGSADTHTASIDWGDGTASAAPVSESAGSGSASGSHTYSLQGTYTVRLTVTDKDGGAGSTATTLTIAPPINHPPTAVVAGPYSGVEGSAIAFNGTGSSDPDGDAIAYDWDFGDGSPHGTGASPNHVYLDNGTYSVSLTVTDSKGLASAPSTTTVTVTNVAPTASFNSPASVVEGSSIALSLTGASDPSSVDGGAGFQYAFDCGDGAGYGAFGSANSTTCPTSDNGSRTVRGRIRDKDGGVSEYTATVSVTNAAPVISSITGPTGSIN